MCCQFPLCSAMYFSLRENMCVVWEPHCMSGIATVTKGGQVLRTVNYENSGKHLVTQNRFVAVHISKCQYTTFYHTVQALLAIRPQYMRRIKNNQKEIQLVPVQILKVHRLSVTCQIQIEVFFALFLTLFYAFLLMYNRLSWYVCNQDINKYTIQI